MTSPERQRVLLVTSVFVDLIGVALVVPLLPMRLRELGASQRTAGLVSSAYSAAQICGGLALGVLSDRCLGRRGLLLLSFAGAGSAYAILGLPHVPLELVVLSRVIVGLTKQTMTASAAMMTELTAEGAERACWIGRLSSAAQTAWISGQALGGLLNRGSARAPAAVAVGLYAMDFTIVRSALPASPPAPGHAGGTAEGLPQGQAGQGKSRGTARVLAAFASPELARIVFVRLLEQFVMQAIFTTRALYELDRWALTREEIGYLASFKSLVGVFSSWHLAGSLSRRFSCTSLLYGATTVAMAAYLLESVPGAAVLRAVEATAPGRALWAALGRFLSEKLRKDPSLLVFCVACFPAYAACNQVVTIALKSRFTEVVPKANVAAALSSLDVMQSAVGVVAPLAGGLLFNGLAPTQVPLLSAALHAAVVLLLLGCFPLGQPEAQKGSKAQ